MKKGNGQAIRLTTYGFLVAVESPHPISREFIDQAISNYMDNDNNFSIYGDTIINVEALGEIECYGENKAAKTTPTKGADPKAN